MVGFVAPLSVTIIQTNLPGKEGTIMTNPSITFMTANPKEEALAAELAELQAEGLEIHPALTPRFILALEEKGFVVDLVTAQITAAETDQVAPSDFAFAFFGELAVAA